MTEAAPEAGAKDGVAGRDPPPALGADSAMRRLHGGPLQVSAPAHAPAGRPNVSRSESGACDGMGEGGVFFFKYGATAARARRDGPLSESSQGTGDQARRDSERPPRPSLGAFLPDQASLAGGRSGARPNPSRAARWRQCGRRGALLRSQPRPLEKMHWHRAVAKRIARAAFCCCSGAREIETAYRQLEQLDAARRDLGRPNPPLVLLLQM